MMFLLILIWAGAAAASSINNTKVTSRSVPFAPLYTIVAGLPQGGLNGIPPPGFNGPILPGFGNGGGPMIRHPAITTLAWGGGKNGEAVRGFAAVNSFLFDLPATSYAAWIDKEYSTSRLKLGRGRFVRDLLVYVHFEPTITQQAIENRMKKLIDKKILPLNADGNALTIVLLPPGVRVQRPMPSLTSGSARSYSCSDFCAYHSSFNFRKNKQYYIVIPDQSCSGIKSKRLDCLSGLPQLDATTRTVSLQYFNAKTNPAGAEAQFIGPSVGWFARLWGDIGSPCVNFADRIAGPTGVTWTVNQIWSARNTSCLTTSARPRLVGHIYG